MRMRRVDTGAEDNIVYTDPTTAQAAVHDDAAGEGSGEVAVGGNDEGVLRRVDIFSADGERPPEIRYLLGITSLWLLIPGLHGIWHCIFGGPGPLYVVVTAACLIACFVSTVHWAGIHGAVSAGMDRAGAGFLLVTLLIFTLGGFCERALPLFVYLLLLGGVVLFFVAARFAISRSDATGSPSWLSANCCFHLTFRFLGYWWTYLALVPTESAGVTFAVISACINSAAYWLHIHIVWQSAPLDFNCEDEYFSGCLKLSVLIMLCLAIQVFLCYGQ